MSLDPITTSKQFLQNLLLAGTTSVLSQTIATPFERPLHSGFEPSNPKVYMQFMKETLRQEIFLSLWQGNPSKVLLFSIHQTFAFPLNDLFKKIFSSENLSPNTNFSRFFGNLAAGGAAGGVSLLMIYPLIFAREIFYADSLRIAEKQQFGTISDCFKKIFAKDGLRGFYQGFSISALHSASFHAMYFGGYEALKKMAFDEGREGGFIVTYLMAQTVTMAAGMVSYPLNVVRLKIFRNLMRIEGESKYKGVLDCVKKVVAEEGWKGFVKGAGLKPIQVIGPSLNLVLYDKLQGHLFQKKLDEKLL